jgi:RNA polymerase sigma factor (sigma-70 family)
MPSRAIAGVLRHIRQLLDPPPAGGLTDGQLLERFAARQDEAAFETLLHRHGPMVLNLCRGMLHDAHAADDAFQATFLVLACKAASIHKRPSVASWLYGVAYRISLRAKAGAARRRLREREVPPMVSPDDASDDVDRQELRATVTEELHRLPEKYRAPLVLCYLQGKSHDIAARATTAAVAMPTARSRRSSRTPRPPRPTTRSST